jgi:Protein of unknown function (DUF2877)
MTARRGDDRPTGSAMTSTSALATSAPATSVPATSVPATSVPATSVPATRASSAVASVLVRDLVTGPVRRATVVAAGPAAVYLGVGSRLLAVVAPGGVRLPCALVLTADGLPFAGLGQHGGPGRAGRAGLAVGRGAVHQGGRRVVGISRWFDPRVRVGDVDPVAVARLATAVWSRRRRDPLLPDDAVDRLADGLARGDVHRAVAALLGRGTGLTPAGDDLVAGALAALRSVGSRAADDLGKHVRALAPVATSRLSAALLDAAGFGAVVPEAAGVLWALVGVEASAGHDGPGALEAAVARLVGVGHTSGWHLAAGLLVGLSHARRPANAPAAPGQALAAGGSAS